MSSQLTADAFRLSTVLNIKHELGVRDLSFKMGQLEKQSFLGCIFSRKNVKETIKSCISVVIIWTLDREGDWKCKSYFSCCV